MAQNGTETLVCTIDGQCNLAGDDSPAVRPWDPDMPAESLRLKIGEDIDWIDVSAVYERDDSLKGNSNPKNHNSNNNNSKQGGSNSQRFSGNLKPIIGLPGKIQHSSYVGHSARRPPAVRIFPKKAKTGGGGRKQAVPEAEPESPKVSCMGKVLSQRERARRRLASRRWPENDDGEQEEERVGCWVRILGFFCGGACGGGGRRSPVEHMEEAERKPPGNIPAKESNIPAKEVDIPAIAAPGLGGMKRFSSGRRAGWDFETEGEGGHVAGKDEGTEVGGAH